MMRSSRECGLIVLLLLSLGFAVVYSVLQRAEAGIGLHGSVHSERPEGARALYLWLSQLGYDVRTIGPRRFAPSSQDEVLFVLAVNAEFKRGELRKLDRWVRSGGTLIVAQEARHPAKLLKHYRTPLTWLSSPIERAPLRLPVLNWPEVGEVHLHAAYKLRLRREDAAVHIGACDTPLLVAFGRGKGRVLVMSTVYPFTNAGLVDVENARLVQNMVHMAASPGARIAFDEVHHKKPRPISSPAWLTSTKEGKGVLYAAAVLLLYLLLHYQHFGAPLPSSDQTTPRTADEYITAMASMHRRVGAVRSVQRHYWGRLKREVARRYRLDPSLSDEDFLVALDRYGEEIDVEALVSLLTDMQRADGGKRALLSWVRRTLAWQSNFCVKQEESQ